MTETPLWQQGIPLFTGAALIAAFAASSELIGRFRDEPFRVLFGIPGFVFLLLNAALAVAALFGLRLGSKPTSAAIAVEQVLLAGFGARIIARTKVVGARGKEGEEQEIGPGAVFEKILSAISRQADRARAADRLGTIVQQLEGLQWERVRPFFTYEMAGAMQDLTADEKDQIAEQLAFLDENPEELDDPTRVHMIGYLVLNFAGDEFLAQLVALYRKRYPA